MKPTKDYVATALMILGVIAFFFPNTEGPFVQPGEVSVGEARIMAVIVVMAAVLLYYMPSGRK
jgi:hypothetical protein